MSLFHSLSPPRRRAVLGTLALLAAYPAAASDNVNDPSSYAYAAAFGNPEIPQIGIRNGVIVAASGGGSGALATSTSDSYLNTASVSSNTGNFATARADLHAGTVKASVINGPSNVPRGLAESRIQDTVFFLNATDHTVYLPFHFSFDGYLTDPNDFGSTASASFSITGAIAACPDGTYGTCYGVQRIALQNGGNASNTTVIGYAANGRYNGIQQGGAFFFNAPDSVDLGNYTVLKDWNAGGGFYNTVVSSVLAGTGRKPARLRPAPQHRLLASAEHDLRFRQYHHVRLRRSAQRTQLHVGVRRLPDPDAVTPGVPEPATWALLILGFGLTGALQRRRRMVVTA